MENPVSVYSAFFDKQLSGDQYDFYIAQLSVKEQQKLSKFRRWEDATASLIGKILLMKMMQEEHRSTVSLNDMEYTKYNKPFFQNEVDFSIAHSGNYVVCAMARNGKIGIDIERMNNVDITYYKYILSHNELDCIAVSGGHDIFYRVWTKKEAIIKADGRGLNIKLDQVNTLDNPVELEGVFWHTKDIAIDAGYSMSIASDNFITGFNYKHIIF